MEDFDIPSEVHDEDVTLVISVLTALKALDVCSQYKVNQGLSPEN